MYIPQASRGEMVSGSAVTRYASVGVVINVTGSSAARPRIPKAPAKPAHTESNRRRQPDVSAVAATQPTIKPTHHPTMVSERTQAGAARSNSTPRRGRVVFGAINGQHQITPGRAQPLVRGARADAPALPGQAVAEPAHPGVEPARPGYVEMHPDVARAVVVATEQGAGRLAVLVTEEGVVALGARNGRVGDHGGDQGAGLRIGR